MNKRLIYIVIGFIGIIIIPIITWSIMTVSQNGTAPVSVVIAPKNATVEINNQTFKGNETIRVKPGTYTVKISKDGFETDTQKIVIKEDKTNSIISTLNPISDAAKQWYQNNQTEVLRVEGKAGQLSAQQGEEFINQYPITKWLPLQKATYTIGYKQLSENSDEGIVITISAVEGYREAALQEIRDKGFDPSDYTIEFTNYRSPFNE